MVIFIINDYRKFNIVIHLRVRYKLFYHKFSKLTVFPAFFLSLELGVSERPFSSFPFCSLTKISKLSKERVLLVWAKFTNIDDFGVEFCFVK